MEMRCGANSSRIFVWFCIFLYSVAFPFLLWMSLLSFMIFDGSTSHVLAGCAVICLAFSIPISVFVTICKMISACAVQAYARARWFAGIPFLVFFGAWIAMAAIDYCLKG